MKNSVLLLLALVLFSFAGNAQSLQLKNGEVNISNDTLYIIGTTDNELLEAHLTVVNVTDKEVEIQAKKAEVEIVENSENTFCWGACFPPFIFESTTAIKIAPEGSDHDSFVGDYAPDGNIGTSILRYTFFNATNAEDSVSVIVFFQIGAAGVQDWTLRSELVKAYPNPSSGEFTLEFPGSTSDRISLQVMGITGRTIVDKQLDYGQSSYQLDLSSHPDGYYFLRIANQKGQSVTRRILLSR